VVGTAGGVTDALVAFSEQEPDVALVDLRAVLPERLWCRSLSTGHPSTSIDPPSTPTDPPSTSTDPLVNRKYRLRGRSEPVVASDGTNGSRVRTHRYKRFTTSGGPAWTMHPGRSLPAPVVPPHQTSPAQTGMPASVAGR